MAALSGAGAKAAGTPPVVRRLLLDRAPGETRCVVTADGRAERLLIVRDDDDAPRCGALYLGRVLSVSDRLGLARIEIGVAAPASLRLAPGQRLAEGASVEAEVAAEPRGDKGASLRLVQTVGSGRPGRLRPAPSPAELLAAFAPDAGVEAGDEAREAADEAQAEALARVHPLALGPARGLTLTIEPTRALVAVDVDLDATAAGHRSAEAANLQAVVQAARLLRLKSLAGLVAIDLVGFPRDGAGVRAAARAAFAPDGAETVIGPVSRFGVLELSKPHGWRPLHEQLLDADGRATPRTLAQDLVRRLERQGRADPGALWVCACAPAVAQALRPLAAALGPRFSVHERVGTDLTAADIYAR